MRKRQRKELAQSSDIAFLLIIFFLLLAGLDASGSIDLHTGKPTVSETMPCTLTVQNDGTLSFNGDTVSLGECPSLFAPYPSVILEIEPSVPWQTVVDLLSIANETGKEVTLHET